MNPLPGEGPAGGSATGEYADAARERDPEAGLYDDGARDFDPRVARFMGKVPMSLDEGEQSLYSPWTGAQDDPDR